MSPEEKSQRRSVKKAVDKSKIASNNYYRQLHLRKGHDIASTLTNELYALFMCHLLAGTDESVRYTQLLRDDVRRGTGMAMDFMYFGCTPCRFCRMQ